jgi:hypothetical protein
VLRKEDVTALKSLGHPPVIVEQLMDLVRRDDGGVGMWGGGDTGGLPPRCPPIPSRNSTPLLPTASPPHPFPPSHHPTLSRPPTRPPPVPRPPARGTGI